VFGMSGLFGKTTLMVSVKISPLEAVKRTVGVEIPPPSED
jgi:hypothetical protein